MNSHFLQVLGLFANVIPVMSYAPYLQMNFAGIDVVIVKENEEDLYVEIEHNETQYIVQCVKLISRLDWEKL